MQKASSQNCSRDLPPSIQERPFPIISFILVLCVRPRRLQVSNKKTQMPAKYSPTTLVCAWVVGPLLIEGMNAY